MKDFEVDINGIIESVHSALRDSGLEDIADHMHRATNGIEAAASGKEVERSFSVGPQSSLAIGTMRSGDISITATEEPVIRVRYRSRSSNLNQEDPFVAEQTDNHVELNVKEHRGSTDFRVTVPRDCSILVRGLASDIEVSGISGRLELETASGDVSLEDVAGDITIRSVSGDVSGARLNGPFQVHTTSGDISVSESHLSRFDLHSVSGDFSIETSAPSDARFKVGTTSGDMRLFVPGDTGLSVKLDTSSGDVHSHLPVEIIQASKRHWEGTINGGGARLEMRSTSGDLEIRRSSRLSDMPPSPAPTTEPVSPPAPRSDISPEPLVTIPEGPPPSIDPEPQIPDVVAVDDTPNLETKSASEILAALERGEISVDEAMRRLDEGS